MLITVYLLRYRAIEFHVNDDLKIWNIDDDGFTNETCLKNWRTLYCSCQCKFVMNAGWIVTYWVKDLSSTFGQVNKLERMGWKGWKVSKVFFALILCLFLGFVFSITFFLCFFVCVCVCVEETSEVWILSCSYLSLCICRHEKRSQLPERPIVQDYCIWGF